MDLERFKVHYMQVNWKIMNVKHWWKTSMKSLKGSVFNFDMSKTAIQK